MSRHSKNCTATTHFTYEEKRKAGIGTLKKRLGKDSLMAFGCCCLCLDRAVKNPMVTPSGYLYCKECIYENLLQQKSKIKQGKLNYEKYVLELERKQDEEELAKDLKVCQAFIQLENVKQEVSMEKRLSKDVDVETVEEKKLRIKKSSFWVPEYTPNAEKVVKPSEEVTKDPMNEKALKLKQLMPAKLKWSEGIHKYVVCAVSNKEITHQNAVLIKPSGIVMLQSCVKDMVLPSMVCPVTSVKLRKKDIVLLQTGGTSFSAHNNVQAKKYRPSMT